MFQESSKGVKVRLKGISSSCKEVSMVFKISATGVSGKFQRCFKEVSMKFRRSFKSGSKEFQGYFKKVSSVFQGRLKAVSSSDRDRHFFPEQPLMRLHL